MKMHKMSKISKAARSQCCGEHEVYCCGARVAVSEKGVRVLSEPTVEYCPLHKSLYGIKEINAKTVKRSVERKITHFGFCCRNRSFHAEPIVAYGASEMIKLWLEKKLIDCAVVVCEGAGTVITSNGELVQAIGARLTGIIKTSPISEVIEHIEANGGTVLDKYVAGIDQAVGVKQAFEMGFKRIAVSVAGFQAEAIDEIRKFETRAGVEVLIFSVCNTRVRHADVKYICKADLVCASASTILRKEIGKGALLQLGVTIPVYALTLRGRNLILAYLDESKDELVVFRTRKMPYEPRERGPRLKRCLVASDLDLKA